ncbi:hypothetical protein HO173_007812 [Letharia columbiana]|uniref:HTH myb-type domain-containing protein n=1 Tax=Letharia columbiana TaxID=112416 RepID=A0A8H6L3B5_9LECA|nr:uncharacterized protein HO173_007812 [Letharia columbiana]KAF6233982.1 hypothetical protein HO173_007812 [Letharia columbiana]
MARVRRKWTAEEDALLRSAVKTGGIAPATVAEVGKVCTCTDEQRLSQKMVEQSRKWHGQGLMVRGRGRTAHCSCSQVRDELDKGLMRGWVKKSRPMLQPLEPGAGPEHQLL